MKHTTIKEWVIKLRKDGIRRRFLQGLIERLLPHYHLAKNGGRRKKEITEGPFTVTYHNEEIGRGGYPTDQTAAGIPGRKIGGSG